MANHELSDTRQEYVSRVNKVVDLIQHRLDADLSLEALAEEAGFSAFHFHRIFAGVVGEPLHAFVKRARLERAAIELERRPDRSITDIALDFGFSSSANFSRAFKEAFGASARDFRGGRETFKRINEGIRRSAEQLRDQLAAATRSAGRVTPEVTRERFPGAVVAYVRHYGPYEERHKVALFGKIRQWAEKAMPSLSPSYLGICYGDRGLLDPDRRRYDACVLLPEGVAVTAPVARLEIAAGEIAVLRRRTASLMVCDAWTTMHRDWLPGSGFAPDDRPCVERFPEGFPGSDPSGAPFLLDVCQAIRPLL